MEKIRNILEEGFHSVIISQVQKTANIPYNKIEVKAFEKDEKMLYQFAFYTQKQVKHQNVSLDEAVDLIVEKLANEFFQCVIFGKNCDMHITSFAGKFKFKTAKSSKKVQNTSHDRKKNYIITEDEGADFLIELGVCTKEGKLKRDKYPKFRQINKYLEFVDSMKEKFPKNKAVRIVDFGCGKAYLTFALYYYITVKLGLKAVIVGLDLKEDVVNHCQKLSEKLGYTGLHFETGDIGKYQSDEGFDMVISLHACNTATDEALFKAVMWHSKIIFAVPCCQHELNPQLNSENNQGMLRYGLMRERVATLLTDTSRALLLETVGYKCEVAEFIEMEHTPKNILLKAVYTGKKSQKSMAEYQNLKSEWQFEHHFEKLLNKATK